MDVKIVTEFIGIGIGAFEAGDGKIRKELSGRSGKDREPMGRFCCRCNLLGVGYRWQR